ncbi:hypothetical protein LCGC14_3077100, partial [marine sediment metagenome]
CLEILLDIGKVEASEEQFDLWMVEKNEDYLAYIKDMDASEILPDVQKTLDYLKGKKVPLALGSASKNAKPILEKVDLLPYFKVIVDGTNVTKAKPDPEVFLIAAQKLNAKPENCIVFEDAVAGIEAAKAAGMTSIGIGDSKTLTNADYVFKDFTEISKEFLEGLMQ